MSQDCSLILLPYQFSNFSLDSLEDPSDISLEDLWHTHPQLFFKCLLPLTTECPAK